MIVSIARIQKISCHTFIDSLNMSQTCMQRYAALVVVNQSIKFLAEGDDMYEVRCNWLLVDCRAECGISSRMSPLPAVVV